MDFEWVAIALGDVAWICLAFLLGFGARLISLPPLVGFLVTGFLLNYYGADSGEMLQKLADLGITLLLFTVGLKLNPAMLLRPQVWAVTSLHISLVLIVFGSIVAALSVIGVSLFAGLSIQQALILAFALSFSSTVFVVKVLEERSETKSLHGRIAVSILVMQDLAAVIFLAASTGKLPSPWAISLLLLIPLRPLLHRLLQITGHGELLVLYGLVLALGGAELFEIAGIKDDLGALIMGVLVSTHVKSAEMSKAILGLKDLFLVGFFLSIGMAGQLSTEALMIGILLVPLVIFKSVLFYWLMTLFKLRARTSLLATINLSNYSEFGLIVIALSTSSGWIGPEWLVIMAIALSLSFIAIAPFTSRGDKLYRKYRLSFLQYQLSQRLPEDQMIDTRKATIAIFGMGRVGKGCYDKMRELYGDTVLGVDSDADKVNYHLNEGRHVIRGAPNDPDFWENLDKDHNIELVLLALPSQSANLSALDQLNAVRFPGRIAAIARYPDEEAPLREAGATAVFNIYAEAGAGFAAHVVANESG
ncbi:MAG: cation:proton antiporter [Motiliproteus sp.]|nr:cation:proton antiporter [Motiliproteus sp.]MCW9051557.1 cation:proton antiporter [Motiliproteus sp.]